MFARVFTVGAVAQLGARQNGILEVTGSTPVGSTSVPSFQCPFLSFSREPEASAAALRCVFLLPFGSRSNCAFSEIAPPGRHLILIDMAGVGPELLECLARQHAAALVLYARQWCSTPEDVVQEAFLKLVVQKTLPAHPVPWLYRVVRNAALAANRAERRRRHHETIAAARAPLWFVQPDPAGLDAATTTDALRSLPPHQSEVLVARIWGGLTFEQIGAAVGCSAATAYRTYLAGLLALREKMGVLCPDQSTTTGATPVPPT